MTDTPQPRRSLWRFSLRELLLLTVAIAALLGWGVTIFRRYRPLVPTPFASELNLEADVAAVRKQIEEKGPSWTGITNDGSGSSGRRYERDYVLTFALAKAKANDFMRALQQRLIEHVKASGCREGASGYVGSSFRLHYERGIMEGSLRAYLIAGDEQAQLLVFVQEQQQPP